MFVVKRTGKSEEFSVEKIENVLKKVFKKTHHASPVKNAKFVASEVVNKCLSYDQEKIKVEKIQDFIRDVLIENNYSSEAREFILYRNERARIREFVSEKKKFIERFKKASNAANSTVDDNSNVGTKNIGVLNSEIHKEDNIQVSRGMIMDKLGELYPYFDKKNYMYDLENHIIYKHDESSFAGAIAPYTYSSKEVIRCKYNDVKLLVPFDLLWEIVTEEEALVDSVNEVYQKYPNNLFVADKNNNYTQVTHITKKKRHRDLYRIKTSYGEDMVVTDNHPMIVDDSNINNTVEAVNSLNCTQYKYGFNETFTGIDKIDMSEARITSEYTESYAFNTNEHSNMFVKRYVNLDWKLGYVVGFFIGDGNYDNSGHDINFTQADRSTLLKLNSLIFDSLGVGGRIYTKKDLYNGYCLTIASDYLWWLLKDVFKIQDKAQNKTLPCNIYEYNENFAKGILCGLMDSDGSVNGSQLLFRLSSRSAILQITDLLRYFGYAVGNGLQSLPFSNNENHYKTNYTIWKVSCSKREDSVDLGNSVKLKNITTAKKYLKYKDSGKVSITNVQKIEDNDSFLLQNDYIYDITTESHTFILNNIYAHNCVSISMYPFLLNGLKELGGLSAAPKNIDSFCGMFVNLIFAVAAQYAGAVAVSELFVYFDWYARKEWGDDYYLKADELVARNTLKGEIKVHKQIHQYFQQIVYSINQPSGGRNSQAAFVNFSYFDKPFFEGMFNDFCFPDGSKTKWESVNWLQKDFMMWFNEERTKTMLTFPVESFALVYQNGEFLDKDSAKFVCDEYARGHSFFTYISDTVDSLSSCCFSKDQKVLWKSSTKGVNLTTLEELHNTKWEPDKKNLRIFHNGSWVKGKSVKLENRKMYKVTTFNNKEFIMTDNHINVTLDGEKSTDKLTCDDYLMFNTIQLNAVPEVDEHLSYEQGFVVGAFLGDGSFDKEVKGTVYCTQFSQNVNKYEKMMKCIDIANEQLGGENKSKLSKVYNNVYPVYISSSKLAAFIMKWTNWERGTYSYNKELNLDCLLQSYEFRKGILDGWYNTDGGNSNRCYTSSEKLAECMECLITSLGMQSIINVSDRTDEKVIIRGEEYQRNYPLYCVRWYEQANHRANKDIGHTWIKRNNSVYFKIKSIEKVDDYKDDVYCIECNDKEEPYFTLPCGLITHNCRLKNKIQTKEFNFTNGNMSIMTGSKSVITMNLNRIVQNAHAKWIENESTDIPFYDSLKSDMIEILERVYKYHTAYNELLKDMYDANLLPVYKAGFISLNKQYLTIGLNGLNEAAEFLGMECNDNDEYKNFCQLIFSTVKEQNTLHKTKELMFNTEQVPAESLAIKNYNWDKEDGYIVPEDRNLYASYIFVPSDPKLSVFDKLKLHGSDYIGDYLDGGSAAHINLMDHLSSRQYERVLEYSAKVGCQYLTFNVPNCECNKCGHIEKHRFTTCPKCGGTDISEYSRVIGYLTKVSNWSEGRQIEYKTRVHLDAKEDI